MLPRNQRTICKNGVVQTLPKKPWCIGQIHDFDSDFLPNHVFRFLVAVDPSAKSFQLLGV